MSCIKEEVPSGIEIIKIASYFTATNAIMVSTMATRETDTPTYPMTSRDEVTSRVIIMFALSRMVKWVRWSHLHTVTEEFEVLVLTHPLSDHLPALRIPSPCELLAICNNHLVEVL